jgi:hypothetical protein
MADICVVAEADGLSIKAVAKGVLVADACVEATRHTAIASIADGPKEFAKAAAAK